MSLYCKGTDCEKREDCCAYIEGKGIAEGGSSNGVWFIDREQCDAQCNKYFHSYRKMERLERKLEEKFYEFLNRKHKQ